MKLIYESDGVFRFLDYNISHKQLLIRGEKVKDDMNIDLIFEGTDFLNCPTKFEGLKLYLLEEDELNKHNIIETKYHRNFMIMSNGIRCFIKSGLLRIYINSLEINESSIDMTGKGQEKLLWISTQRI